MLTWHMWGVARGETVVEAQDHEVYAKRAKERSDVRSASSPCAWAPTEEGRGPRAFVSLFIVHRSPDTEFGT